MQPARLAASGLVQAPAIDVHETVARAHLLGADMSARVASQELEQAHLLVRGGREPGVAALRCDRNQRVAVAREAGLAQPGSGGDDRPRALRLGYTNVQGA